jgi:hypothetical protein
MVTSNGTVGDQVEGLVESVNDRGIRVAGEWRNISKFHPVDLPERGARVRLDLDGKGFIRSLTLLDGAPSSTSSSSSASFSREREIRRQVAIKTAAQLVGAFAQTHEEVRTDHIFPLADRILAWLEQPDREEDEAQF